VMIAHRLSTIRESDVVYYMKAGELVSFGTFDELRKQVSDFDHQAKLMGL
jgi:ABC-type multidrug transport system fused ATPase/permease subunit